MPKTILDRASINSLLKMAGEEGLLKDRLDRGDKLLYSLTQRTLPEWHRQQILEQVILNSKLYSKEKIPFDWLEGDFLDLDLIQCFESQQTLYDEILDISPELLEGILLANGIKPDFIKFKSLFKKGLEISDKIEKYKQIHSISEFNKISIFVCGMIDSKYRNSQEYKLAEELNKINIEIGPIIRVIEEIIELSQYARDNEFQLKIPVYKQSANLINLSDQSYNDYEAIKVFRITTQKLGVIPFCSTLRQSLKLANDPATIALRNQIENWLVSLKDGIADKSIFIQNKIQKANDRLLKSYKLKTAGFFSGIIAIPVSAVGILNPFLGALGLSLSCIAVIFERTAKKIENNVKWIGFGSR